jgi:hypothetical protein
MTNSFKYDATAPNAQSHDHFACLKFCLPMAWMLQIIGERRLTASRALWAALGRFSRPATSVHKFNAQSYV